MSDKFGDIAKKLNDYWDRITRLESLEFSKVSYPYPGFVRVLDDNTPRAAAYSNAAVQVTGTGGLPAKISAVWLGYAALPTAAGQFTITVKNPLDTLNNPTRVGGYASVANGSIAGLTFVTLNASGQFQFINNQAMNRTVWDVVAYII